MGQIKIKDHLSPAEAEVGTELGRKKDSIIVISQKYTYIVLQGLNWIIDSLLSENSITSCVISFNIYLSKVPLSTCFNKHERLLPIF